MNDLLRIIARAMLESADSGAFSDSQPNADLAETIWTAWTTRSDRQALQQALTDIAAASRDKTDDAVQQVLDGLDLAAGSEVSKTVRGYLRVLPGYVRRRTRPALPGATPRPTLLSAQDLLQYLPARTPWYEVGERPPGIGDWELEELLAVDSASETWKAFNPRRLERDPAVLHFLIAPQARDYLRGPGLATLQNVLQYGKAPGILALEQIHAQADPPCLQYEYDDAADLTALVRHWRAEDAKLDPLVVTDIVRQIAEALAPLHERKPPLVYRNFRPGNVLVKAAEGRLECRVCGLGLGPWLGNTSSQDRLYTEPPWVLSHAPQAADDIYALGILWHQLLVRNFAVGRPGGLSWRKHLAGQGISLSLIELMESCWDDDPAQRPADAAALVRLLAGHMTKAPAATTSPTPAVAAEPLGRSRPRRANLDKLFDTLEKVAPERIKAITTSTGMKLALIPEGGFMMGSPADETSRKPNEDPPHEVQITKAFYLGVSPVTQEQYSRVMDINPARFSSAQGGGADHPVENVSWHDAVEFCRRLSELETEKQAGRRYRLPTEAEWEYACRAGTTTAFSFGAALAPGQANFDTMHSYGTDDTAPPVQKTTPVGSYPANNFGLYDLHGNVWEWCADWLDSNYYRASPRRDPPGPPNGTHRVVRGGSWRNHALTCRSAYRNGLTPTSRDMFTGFRVVMEG